MNNLRTHLIARRCNPDTYHVHIDEENNTATFMLFNLSGQMVGYQQYRPDRPKNTSGGRAGGYNPYEMRYFTKIDRERFGFFGFPQLNPEDRTLYVVEGLFDACALHSLGKNAIAVLCNNPKPMREQIQVLGYNTVAVCDGGREGRRLANVCNKSVTCPEGEDPSSMTEEALLNLIGEPK